MSEIIDKKTEAVPLSALRVSETGIIQSYLGKGDLHHRLRELGLVRGTAVTVKRFAPFGDPMEILVRGYSLSLRKKDAAEILVIRK